MSFNSAVFFLLSLLSLVLLFCAPVGHAFFVPKYCNDNQMSFSKVYPLSTVEGSPTRLLVKECAWSVSSYNGFCLSTMRLKMNKARCFCIEGEACTAPGPTLTAKPGQTVYVQLVNQLQGAVDIAVGNPSVDVVNLHSHGLHISGAQDNVFLKVLPNGGTHTYKWDIIEKHYPGTHWYHAHRHKSTAMHVMGGLYGSLIITSETFNPDFDHVILLSSVYMVDDFNCGQCGIIYYANAGLQKTLYFEPGSLPKIVQSYCALWCQFTPAARKASAIGHSVQLGLFDHGMLEMTLANGKYQPVLHLGYALEPHRFRIVGASAEFYTQLHFTVPTAVFRGTCMLEVLARDGIAFKQRRNVFAAPYFGYYLLPPGGRVDFVTQCEKNSLLVVGHTNMHPNYPLHISGHYSFNRNLQDGEETLFYVQFGSGTRQTTYWADIAKDLPPPLSGLFPYLVPLDEKTDEEVQNTCSCKGFRYTNGYPIDLLGAISGNTIEAADKNNKCFLELHEGLFTLASFLDGTYSKHMFEVNSLNFVSETATKPVFQIKANTIYEFKVFSGGHPFHLHVNPFQVQENLVFGYVAMKGDFMDTLGYAGTYTMRTFTADFTGHQVLHCHFLAHEDLGMMGYLEIKKDETCTLTPNTAVVVDYDYDSEDDANEDERDANEEYEYEYEYIVDL